LETFKKEAKNVYKPTILSGSMELCGFFGGKDGGFFNTFLPTIRTVFDKWIHLCPYEVIFELRIAFSHLA
jgi:hypothetical protein